jgi:hypothetical protein
MNDQRLHIYQCEGCEFPLGSYMAEYERGEIDVTWELCPSHAYTSVMSSEWYEDD